MKDFLQSKLILPLVLVVLLASVVAVSFLSSSSTYAYTAGLLHFSVTKNKVRHHSPSPDFFTGWVGASKALKRISQLSPSQYNSPEEYKTWRDSTCSAAAMTEVINAYGHHYRITDILKVEAGLGEISPALGLLEPIGIDHTVARFGFTTRWLTRPLLDEVILVANHGRPVIVDFPPSRWAGGHFLVVIGGNNNYVYTADSSSLNIRVFTRRNFLKYWAGFAVVVTPFV